MSCLQVANWICIPLLLKMWFVFDFKASNPDFISCVILNFHTSYNDTFDTNVGDAYFVSFPANLPSGAGWLHLTTMCWYYHLNRNSSVHVHLALQWCHEWARWRHKSPASWWFVQPFVQEHIKENIKAPRLRPLWVEFIDDRWTPFHEELVMRKMFPFDDVILARVSTIYHIRGMANKNVTFTMIWWLLCMIMIHCRYITNITQPYFGQIFLKLHDSGQ